MVNESIRFAIERDIRSRGKLSQVAYADLGKRHAVYKQYIPSAFGVALAAVKGHRRRLKKGRRSSGPYVRRLMLEAENQSYALTARRGGSGSRSAPASTLS